LESRKVNDDSLTPLLRRDSHGRHKSHAMTLVTCTNEPLPLWGMPISLG
jgi:hypothetical protein